MIDELKLALRGARIFAKAVATDIGGVAALEFALILPVMILMLLGCVEVSDASTVSVRVINISGVMADVVARCATISAGDLNDIFRISDAVLGRYSRQPLYLEVISVGADANNNLTVDWSYDRNRATPYAPGAPYKNMPVGLMSPGTHQIIAIANYNYRSPVGHYIHGYIKLTHTSYNSPRVGAQVTWVPGTAAVCNTAVNVP